MSCLIADVLTGTISTSVSNAAVNASGKLLKAVEMQYKYGPPVGRDGIRPELQLVNDENSKTG